MLLHLVYMVFHVESNFEHMYIKIVHSYGCYAIHICRVGYSMVCK